MRLKKLWKTLILGVAGSLALSCGSAAFAENTLKTGIRAVQTVDIVYDANGREFEENDFDYYVSYFILMLPEHLPLRKSRCKVFRGQTCHTSMKSTERGIFMPGVHSGCRISITVSAIGLRIRKAMEKQ